MATQAQGFGNIVHALADRISRGEVALPTAGADPGAAVEILMVEVDRVWNQLPFRTPWSAAREREEVVGALRRFIAWHTRAEARTVLATEQEFSVEMRLPDGAEIRLRGFADRLELDSEGALVVIDLKTSKYPPAEKEVQSHPQLGLYQLAVEHGGFDEALPPGVNAEPGGAELWQLRQATAGPLKVQRQEIQKPDETGVRPIEQQLMLAAQAVREERFPARPDEAICRRCDFTALCPAHNAGTVLS